MAGDIINVSALVLPCRSKYRRDMAVANAYGLLVRLICAANSIGDCFYQVHHINFKIKKNKTT